MQKPPIVLPVELGVTIEDMFRPVDRAAVPKLADLLDLLAERHPLVLAAVADVDRSLIWAMQENAPLQNLDNCSHMARDVASLTAPAPSSQLITMPRRDEHYERVIRISALDDRISGNRTATKTRMRIHDDLLPRLLSDELAMAEAERDMGAVA